MANIGADAGLEQAVGICLTPSLNSNQLYAGGHHGLLLASKKPLMNKQSNEFED